MVFGIGSKSAQTPSEGSQQAGSNTDREGRLLGGLLSAINPGRKYYVCHKWRKVGDVAKRGMAHHSQIFVTYSDGSAAVNFGLFQGPGGAAVFHSESFDNPDNPYHTSTSYKPNPVLVSGRELIEAYISTCRKCGPDYKLLHNNCQKFGRLLMTALGASHSRELFHP